MTSIAIFRLPYKHHSTLMAQHDGEPEVLSSVAQLNGKEGFVIAPFVPSAECPVLLMHPDEVRHLPIRNVDVSATAGGMGDGDAKAMYAADFDCFRGQLQAGVFRKIVLARCAHVEGMPVRAAEDLFMRACQLYPRLFVALVSTPLSGTWLMATPEVLLRGNGDVYETMSLAGTQRAQPSRRVADYPVEGVEWSEKNREEQQYVTSYIEDIVRSFSSDYSQKGPYTTMAANLYHLRTDFRFRLRDTACLGDVLDRLFPTPAVCGIPKEEARRFILEHEHTPRRYYSGFVGPLSPSGQTQLFVSLRCMNIHADGACDLYAGGGLLKESEMEAEWAETEAKMETIYKVLNVEC